MTINWNGAELNLGSLAALAAITFLINAASTISIVSFGQMASRRGLD